MSCIYFPVFFFFISPICALTAATACEPNPCTDGLSMTGGCIEINGSYECTCIPGYQHPNNDLTSCVSKTDCTIVGLYGGCIYNKTIIIYYY